MSDDTKICPFCGKEIKASDIKCEYCGKFLIENHSKTNNKRAIKISIIAGFCLILFLILLTPAQTLKNCSHFITWIWVCPLKIEPAALNIKPCTG